MIERLHSIDDARSRFRGLARKGKSIGFVPTMGALHDGHISLLERARSENDCVVVSIFVNPTQFDDKNDLKQYARPLERDLMMANDAGARLAFLPSERDLYADDYRYRVSENELSLELEGSHRAGHFDGVLTIVLKLLNIVRPDRAYFGEKDWQQLELVRGMAEALFLDCEIVPCPTVREDDGLAMSSRNERLGEKDRALAPLFHTVLCSGVGTSEMIEALEDAGFGVDYVERRKNRILGAVRLGNVRLIDNVES